MALEGLHEDFRDLLVGFADASVEFVIVGAYAGREALLTNKVAAGRPQDLADADRLRRMPPDR